MQKMDIKIMREGRIMGRNAEGYPDSTASKAIRAAGHMPEQIYKDYCILRAMAYRMGLEITEIRDRKTKKKWKRGG